jgi:sugar lactone lactonase YvrE
MRHECSARRLSSLALLAAAMWSPTALADDPPVPEVIATFDPAALEVPESLATDPAGNIYVSLALTGEIHRIDRNGEVELLAQLPIAMPLEPCFGFVGGQTGLTHTPWGLYVNVNSCDADARGIWRVSKQTGHLTKVASLPPEVFANGIAHRSGYVYVSDSFSGRIFRAPAGGGEATVWVEDPLLDPAPGSMVPVAANGVQFYEDELYVANSSTGDIIAIEIDDHHGAGASRVHATLENPCDDFAFDLYGTIYCGTNPVNTVVAIYPDGETEVVLEGAAYLDGPSSLAFGRNVDRHTLYVANASFPFYPNHGEPSVIAIELEVPGHPQR